jgi:hypothetical protein
MPCLGQVTSLIAIRKRAAAAEVRMNAGEADDAKGPVRDAGASSAHAEKTTAPAGEPRPDLFPTSSSKAY